MKAIVRDRYGSPGVMRLEEVPTPTPADDQVLIEIRAVSLNAFDWHMLRGDPFLVRLMGSGLFRPKARILGADVAGLIEAVGKGVKRFKPGDAVYSDLSGGGFAEYACAREDLLAPMPSEMTFEEAAAVPMAALTALQGLRDSGGIAKGRKVLINGASGGVGTFAVQLARHFEADVTAVCSTRNVEQARALGADRVINYTQEDFTGGSDRYDLIFVVNGNQSIFKYKRALTPNGRAVMAGGGRLFQTLVLGPIVSMVGGRKIVPFMAKPSADDLAFISELIAAGEVKSVIDRRYSLDETPDAMRYLEDGHAKGKVVVVVRMG